MKPIVYLAGPVTGLSYAQVTTWRTEAKRRLAPNVECADPMRGFEHLQHETLLKHTYIDHPFTTRRGIMMRDYFDVCRSTALLVNMLSAPDVSKGTIMELAWAFHCVSLSLLSWRMKETSMIAIRCCWRLTISACRQSTLGSSSPESSSGRSDRHDNYHSI
jgi:hypothetical protein